MPSIIPDPDSYSDGSLQGSGSKAPQSESHVATRVFHYSQVPSDMNALRFWAAASQQIVEQPSILARVSNYTRLTYQDPRHKLINILPSTNELVTSPYRKPGHLLTLNFLEEQNRLIALALTFLKPVRPDYATAAYGDALNWNEVIGALKCLLQMENRTWKKQSFYVVYFRSTLKSHHDNDLLYGLDEESHKEATISGGLLKYWFGSAENDKRNLATCLWRSKGDAIKGGQGPWHKKARAAAKDFFEKIEFGRLSLTIDDDVSSWGFQKIDD